VSLINSSDQEFSGAQIGGTVVLLPRLVDRSYTRLSYSATNADTHIIGGLMPSTAYSLNISGNNYSIEPGGFRQSDSGGVLRVAINLPLSDGVFSGNRSNYSITPSGSSYNVSDNVGSGGTVSVGSVTRLRFNDTWVALDVNGNAGNVFRLYQAAFDRAPDAGGMGFHLATMEKLGFTLRQVAENFVNSAEFAAKYANTSNAQFITLLYQNILHRQPEAGGFAFWVGVLDRGAESRTGILNSFAASQENQDGTATSLQSGINYTPFNF
jgi:hypothetical protein